MEVIVKPLRTTACAIALSGVAPAALAAGSDFRIDAVHSQIFFSASHDGYTNPSGRLRVKEGTFHFDADDWSQSRVDATIDIATLDMGDAPWNEKLLNAFFDAKHYPTAHFVSTRVEKTGERTGVIHGKLTLLDKTRPIDVQVTFNKAAVNGYSMHYVAGFSAQAKFKRSEFGMTRDLNSVGDMVDVRLEIEGRRDGDAKTPAETGSAEKPDS
jgi:polyisoprenoid-binding protein YceI